MSPTNTSLVVAPRALADDGTPSSGNVGLSTDSLSTDALPVHGAGQRQRHRLDRPSFIDEPGSASSRGERVPADAIISSLPKPAAVTLSARDVDTTSVAGVSAAASLRTSGIQPLEVEDRSEPSSVLQAAQRRTAALQFGAVCFCFFVSGWNDGSTGPLVPTVQRYYDVGYAIVSLIFVLNCIGYVTGAVSNIYLADKFGFGKMIVLGSILQTSAYVMQAPAGPFGTFVAAYLLDGVGMALQQAHGNAYVGSLDDRSKMGFLHASYGVGAFCAPLLATRFAPARHWSFHYLVSAGLSLANGACLAGVFRLRRLNDVLADAGHAPPEAETDGPKYGPIMRIKLVHLLALWALVYEGVEYTLGGWMVTYIQEKRGGGAAAGYISSGFFGGLALGRVLLMGLHRLIGENRAMYLYMALVIALQATVWAVPSLIENGIAVSVIGLFLGPMYPMIMGFCTRSMPRWLLTGAVGWVAAVGMSGTALLPFVSGVLSARFGIGSLQPLLIALMAVMMGLWAGIPKGHTRID